MMRFDREQIQMVLALFLVAAIAAVLLGMTDLLTREPIAAAQRQTLHHALEQVLPGHSNDAQAEAAVVAGHEIYPARQDHQLTGLAWEVVAPDGYSGSIHILIGLRPDGHLLAIRVTDHKETPGLGDGIVRNQSWLDSFRDHGLDDIRWLVKKDGGDFDQFTGATITPRAVVKAVRGALEFYRANRAAIVTRFGGEAHAVPVAAGVDNK